MEKIRTFVAIPISSEVRQACAQLLKDMEPIPAKVKWVKPESIHITLKFLGNLQLSDVQRVEEAVGSAVKNIAAFSLQAEGIGAFPSFRRPRVFWVGLNESSLIPLHMLQQRVESELVAAGFPAEERPFKPHLTLGRVKTLQGIKKVVDYLKNYSFPSLPFMVKEVLVMRSQLRPEGAYYSVLNAYRLRTP